MVIMSIYWNGKNETTKEEVRKIIEDELSRQGAYEFWTNYPEDFECVDKPHNNLVVMHSLEDKFDNSVIDSCFSYDDKEMYVDFGCGFTAEDFKGWYDDKAVCVWREGEWLDAN